VLNTIVLNYTVCMIYHNGMAGQKSTQRTPKGHEIPVPAKDDVFKVLEKAAELIKSPKPLTPRRRPKK
jgi:hypothetical protein